MPMWVRAATLDDIPKLLQFEQDLIEVERAYDPDLRPDDVHYYDLEALISSNDSELFVAHDGEHLLASGYVQLRDAKPIYAHTRVGYIGFVFVAESARGRGLAQLILESLCDWTRERGVSHVELGVYTDNAAAIALYEREGFQAISQTMIKAL